jgi:hypothetical protein
VGFFHKERRELEVVIYVARDNFWSSLSLRDLLSEVDGPSGNNIQYIDTVLHRWDQRNQGIKRK